MVNNRITDAIVDFIPEGISEAIDAGCGDGVRTASIKDRLPHIDITAFDVSEEAIRSARERFSRISFHTGDLMELKVSPRRKYGLCILLAMLHHIPDASIGLKAASSLSDRLLILEPNGNNPILKVIERMSRYHREHGEKSFSERQLRSYIDQIGYTVTRLGYLGFVPTFCPDWLARVIYTVQPWLEKSYLLKRFFSAQIIILCDRQ